MSHKKQLWRVQALRPESQTMLCWSLALVWPVDQVKGLMTTRLPTLCYMLSGDSASACSFARL
eukprot:2265065-Amphidinium_carterae.1